MRIQISSVRKKRRRRSQQSVQPGIMKTRSRGPGAWWGRVSSTLGATRQYEDENKTYTT